MKTHKIALEKMLRDKEDGILHPDFEPSVSFKEQANKEIENHYIELAEKETKKNNKQTKEE